MTLKKILACKDGETRIKHLRAKIAAESEGPDAASAHGKVVVKCLRTILKHERDKKRIAGNPELQHPMLDRWNADLDEEYREAYVPIVDRKGR